MSDEKQYNIKNKTRDVLVLIERFLSKLSEFEILRYVRENSEASIDLHILGVLMNPEWPENITLKISEREIYVCFYAVNVKIREKFISQLVQNLSKNGVDLEEIED